MKGIIFDIQRNSLNDGPGIRTNVFLKGCSLNCLWCHNEESIDPSPLLRFFPGKCTHCMSCVLVCKSGAQLNVNGLHKVNFEACTSNWDCVSACPEEALVRTGEHKSVSEIMEIVQKDKAYYGASGGGMTLSGGEPMLQFDFTMSMLKAAKVAGIHTCMDTAGNVAWEQYEKVLPFTDIFLFDYKETEATRHMDFTGVDNKLILENLKKLNAHGAEIILRCPLIPGLNDKDDHFRAIAELSNTLTGIREVHILPYHTMGISKVEQHGIKGLQKEYPVPDDAKKKAWRDILEYYDTRNLFIF